MGTQDTFYAFMEGYTRFLEEMASQEGEKYAALLSYDAKKMDRAIAGQQAMNMRFEKLETQRAEAQRRAGFGDLPFREILERLGGEEREAFSALFGRLGRTVADIKYYNAKSLSFAKEGLHSLRGVEETPVASPYTPLKGKTPGAPEGGSPLFEAKV